jgi:hypothetical protein
MSDLRVSFETWLAGNRSEKMKRGLRATGVSPLFNSAIPFLRLLPWNPASFLHFAFERAAVSFVLIENVIFLNDKPRKGIDQP